MKFADVKSRILTKKGHLVNCKLTSPVWDKFALYCEDDVVFADFAYCRECFSGLKIYDSKSNF